MTSGPVHTKSASQSSAAVEKLDPFPDFCRDGDVMVSSEDTEKAVRNGGGDDSGVPVKGRQHHHQRGLTMIERPTLPPRLPGGSVLQKDQQTGELPAFGEHRARQNEAQDSRRLRGKLKWLFEQDRVYWETNSAKSSRGGSPERRDSKPEIAETATGEQQHQHEGEANAEGYAGDDIPKSSKDVHEGHKRPTAHFRRPKGLAKSDGAKDAKGECDVSARGGGCTNKFAFPKASPWSFSGAAAKFWHRKPKAIAQDPKEAAAPPPTLIKEQSNGDHPAAAVERTNTLEQLHNRRLSCTESATLMSELMSSSDLGRGGDVSDDGSKEKPEPGDETTDSAISDEDGEDDDAARRLDSSRQASSLTSVKHQAACLKAKCEVLSKEKAHAVSQWQASRVEIDEAAQLAQALRTGIETLLEAGTSNSRSEFKARQDVLEEQTEALKSRMEKLRRKNSEGLVSQSSKRPNKPLHDRMIPLRETSEAKSLTSPEIPRDTEHNVEALRARLEKLMLATNCRVIDEQGQPSRITEGHEKTVLKSQSTKEKGELKMKGWLNSLSAEWTTDGSLLTKVCNNCNGKQGRFILTELEVEDTPLASKENTPVASKQGSPGHSAREPDREDPESSGSAPLSEDLTKKMVIHKIAEEVKLEAKQWYQVQDLLGRVGEDMKSLQEACSTWEKRATLAENQVAFMQQEEQEKSKRFEQGFEDEKVIVLQQEMLGLRETVEDVRMRLGSNDGLDPSKWFEAAQKFGYAFVPVNIPHMQCDCKGKCKSPSGDEGTPDLSAHVKQKGSGPVTCRTHRSTSSTNSPAAPSAISSRANTPTETELRWRTHEHGQQWACEVAGTEKEEMKLTHPTTPLSWRESGRFEQVDHSAVKEMYDTSPHGGRRLLQERQQQSPRSKLRWESSGSRGDALLQLQSSTRERVGVLHHQHEQVARFSNFSGPGSRRSPLRDVLENISSSKENEQPP